MNNKLAFILILIFSLSLIVNVIASELPANPSQYESMKVDDIVNLKPADFDKMISSQQGIDKVNTDDVWNKLKDEQKEIAFKKNFGAFSDPSSKHADNYFSKKLGKSISGLDFSGEYIKYDGQMITTGEGKVKLDTKSMPIETKGVDFTSYSMTVTTEGNNKITVENDGIIGMDRTITLGDGSKINVNMNDYNPSGGQEIRIVRDIDDTQIKFVRTDDKTSVAFDNLLGEKIEYFRGSSSGEGSIVFGKESYTIDNIKVSTDSANVMVGKSAELYFDDEKHFLNSELDKWDSGIKATRKSFVQFDSSGNLNVQGRDMEIDINKPTKVMVQGERILFNDNGNKIRFGVDYPEKGIPTPFRKDMWANPENQATFGDYTNPLTKWNVHNYNLNVNNFNRRYIEPVTDVLSVPVKVGVGTAGAVGVGIYSGFKEGFGAVIKAFSGTSTNTNNNVK